MNMGFSIRCACEKVWVCCPAHPSEHLWACECDISHEERTAVERSLWCEHERKDLEIDTAHAMSFLAWLGLDQDAHAGAIRAKEVSSACLLRSAIPQMAGAEGVFQPLAAKLGDLANLAMTEGDGRIYYG